MGMLKKVVKRMSKYTTEVRFICEHDAGLDASVGFTQVDTVLDRCWNQIFTTNTTFFDESYRSVLCKKILKRYYTREIGCETVGLWKLWMNERLESIMPYYNQLYKSELIEFNPMNDVDLATTHEKENAEARHSAENETGLHEQWNTHNEAYEDNYGSNRTTNDINKTERTVDEDSTDLYSDTPQGSISGLENMNYLTNARKIDKDTADDTSYSGTTDTNVDDKSDGVRDWTGAENYTHSKDNTADASVNSSEDYFQHVLGKSGGASYSKMLMEFRETFLNIDKMVIDEFADLFMGLW